MCGLAGLYIPDGAVEPKLAHRLGVSLKHRGPDDEGFLGWNPGTAPRLVRDPHAVGAASCWLVHTRLSIIDTSAAGWQPMASADGRYFIVFNGEIYNFLELRQELEELGHTFRSRSDTEVLLAAFIQWGKDALRRLVGMFAFAVLDTAKRRLFLVRDFFGIKPLFYTHWNGGFAFASEIKTLLCLPGMAPGIQPQRLYEFFRFGLTDRGGATLFEGIEQLPPAHFLDLSLDRLKDARPVPYWRPRRDVACRLSFEDAAEKLRALFLDSVRLHLRSDVPIGATLSGGIDSSATVMAMRRIQGDDLDLHTFSYIADDPRLSEEKWVDLVGASANAEIHKIRPGHGELVADIDHLIAVQDEPFISTSIYAQHHVFRLAREHGIKVTLDGQGADEYLGGYPTYVAARLASLVRRGQFLQALRFLQHVGKGGEFGHRGVLLRAAGLLLPEVLRTPARRLVDEELYPPWLKADWFRERGVDPAPQTAVQGPDLLIDRLSETLTDLSLPGLLRYADRNSMAFSVESRVPFLTPALVEFVLSLPESYIIAPDGTTKAVFRRAMRGIAPDAVLDRRDKIGFSTPVRMWIKDLGDWTSDALSSDAAASIPAINIRTVRREWEAVRLGSNGSADHIWRLVNVIRWAEMHEISFPA